MSKDQIIEVSQNQSQFSLLKERRFLPFFITQALGALNDNVFKNVLVFIIAYEVADKLAISSSILVNLAAILFILPFFLVSATCGQIAEKFEKSICIRRVKLFEVIIMSLASVGFYFEEYYFLLFVLFLMGFQSALFGPLKYGLLPQHLQTEELVGGNALVETGTFLAILIGLILGGTLSEIEIFRSSYISLTILVFSVAGYIASRKIPYTPAVAPELKINWNVFSETYKNIRFLRKNKTVFLAVLGISWFWFYGAIFMTQIPEYTKSTLAGEKSVATLLLTAFCFGIGLGSILCEKLSNGRVEVGLVPVGAFGLSFFAYDLYLANQFSGLVPIYNYSEFLQLDGSFRILIDSCMIGAFGGLFTVPLYALIQKIGSKKHMSRLFAGLNIVNAFFMVLSGLFAIALLQSGFSIPQLFMITACVNALVAIYIFVKAPEFIFRFITWLLVNTLYRIKTTNMDKIPKHGAYVLVCNHVSFVDALIIAGYCKRNIRFVMHHTIFKQPVIGSFFKMANAIPIAPAHEDKALMQSAFDKIACELENGEVVCIFPEGKLTPDGKIGVFKGGIDKIIQRTPVPVVPMALNGLWGSWFSRFKGRAMQGLPKRFKAKIHLSVGDPVAAELATAQNLFEQVKLLKTIQQSN